MPHTLVPDLKRLTYISVNPWRPPGGLFDLGIHRDAEITANSWSSVRLEWGNDWSSTLASFNRSAYLALRDP